MPTPRQAIILFSPAIVLIVWAVVCAADDGDISGSEIVFFLFLLGVTVACAEHVRGQLRRKLHSKIEGEKDGRTGPHS